MRTPTPGVPLETEYHPSFAGYIAEAQPVSDILRRLSQQLEDALKILDPLSPEQQLYCYAPGKWSVKEVLGHIIDAERIFAYRALRFARNDMTPLPGFDENSYVANAEAGRCDWDELLEEFRYVRKASILLFAHIPDASWMRTGTSNGHPLSVRALAYIVAGHAAHHLTILRERYL